MSLAHNGHNQLSDSHTGEENNDYLHGGLSDMGREAIAEMNRLGIMIDISHPSKASIMQTLELSVAPVIASHSSARAITNHSRNLDDEMLLAVKSNGGVVQTTAFSTYVNEKRRTFLIESRAELEAQILSEIGFEILSDSDIEMLSAEEKLAYDANIAEFNTILRSRINSAMFDQAPPATVADFVDHIEYMIDLIGIEHVGVSSDFDGGGGISGWNDASETFNITLELVKRGYSETQIGKLWSGNLLRVLDEVQRIAVTL